MAFEDLTSDRVKHLLVALLEEMDPEEYASFYAYEAFGAGSGILFKGVGNTPDKKLEQWGSKYEKTDLLELQDAGYVHLETRQQSVPEGRITTRAREGYREMARERGAEQIASGDPDLDHLAELLTNRTAGDCGNRQVKRLAELEVDMVKRGLHRSGIEERQKVAIAIAYMDEYSEQMLKELVALVRKAHGSLRRQDADWIKRRLGRDLDLLKAGQAGWCVTSTHGQRELADSIQQKNAALSAALEIEVRTEALEARRRQQAQSAVRGVAGHVAPKTDVFISHASEDKDAVAGPLAHELQRHGFSVWYDEYVLKLGDSLPREIDRGLGSCRFGVVILSPHFFAKNWPQRELDGLAAREVHDGRKVILPVWHNVGSEDVCKYSPTLGSKLAVSTTKGISTVVDEIVKVLDEPAGDRTPGKGGPSGEVAPAEVERPTEAGEHLAEQAAVELQAIANTKELETALDAKACFLLDACHEAFRAHVTRWQEQNALAKTTVVRKKADPGGAFALGFQSPYRFPRSGSCAFTYELRPPDMAGEAKGWVQVEVSIDSSEDPLLVVRWHSTFPQVPAERVLQEPASLLKGVEKPADARTLIEECVANVFGRAMSQLSEQVKERNTS